MIFINTEQSSCLISFCLKTHEHFYALGNVHPSEERRIKKPFCLFLIKTPNKLYQKNSVLI